MDRDNFCQNLNFAKINFKVRASVFCFSKERAQTRAQAARSFLEGLKLASPRTALLRLLALLLKAFLVHLAKHETQLRSPQ